MPNFSYQPNVLDIGIALLGGILYKSQGRYSEAEPLYVQALDIAEQQLGATHPTTATIRKNLERLRSTPQL